ncbi:uncharacterized protein CCOS01_14416 [Colletotrichum costaricense]|uniref:Short-chain dehydrogenase n=1 Tax=Colletotrichum costaricense TaxID=1209916 RepID=A0AAI9YJS8_9PEZI|nr:uncharacterized protein CCOS01_14416 [Colletotrichum costaricense]KAK1513474.1 hypothetical protein CCOS01_14416 [Colletotrichum costaricense]
MTETVLVFGATGNIGVAVIIGALRAKRHVIAVVRSQASAEKMFKYVGSRDNITVVEADLTSEDSLRGVVDQVRAGKLPAFQHVWASPGGLYWETPILEIDPAALREVLNVNFESYFYAYRVTVPYLLEQGFAGSTWTLCTGAQGDYSFRAAPAVTQGALFSFAIAASRENEKTNIRFNEVYLAYRVQFEVDEETRKAWAGAHLTTCDEFAPLYQQLLDREDIRGSRVKAITPKDVLQLSVDKRYKA